MRTLSKEELQEILEKHKKWLTGKDGGERADLRGADLRKADLRGADLRKADFRGADLREADFRGADFRWAVFIKANFRKADLRGADLRWTLFREADFRWADSRGADFSEVNLRNASIYFPIACPETGSFIGYKKAGDYIVKLKILDDAKRSSATSRKCRCDKAEVVAIENVDDTVASVDSVASNRDRSFVYRIGEVVCVDDFDDNRWNECAPGIHFFITRDEAVRYV